MPLARLAPRTLPALALTVGLGAGSAHAEPAADAEADVEPASSTSSGGASSSGPATGDGFFKKRGYLHIAPGIMSVSLSSYPVPLYTWGLSGGYHLPVTDRFIIEIGGFFDHTLRAAFGFGSTHVFGIGPELRLGGGTPKIFGYGLVRLGVGITHISFRDPTPDPDDPDVIRATGAGFLTTLGGGIQGLVHPHVALGGEPAFDVYAGGGGAVGFFRLRFLVAILF